MDPINIPQMLAYIYMYIPYMDPMSYSNAQTDRNGSTHHRLCLLEFHVFDVIDGFAMFFWVL